MQMSQLEEQFAPPGLLPYLDRGGVGTRGSRHFLIIYHFYSKKLTFTANSAAGRVYSSASTKLNYNLEVFNRTITRVGGRGGGVGTIRQSSQRSVKLAINEV